MASSTLEKRAKITASDDAIAQAKPPQEIPGFYTNVQKGDEKGADKEKLAREIAVKLKEIFPDPKYWAVTPGSPEKASEVQVTLDSQKALIDKLMALDNTLTPAETINRLKASTRFKGNDGKYFNFTSIGPYDVSILGSGKFELSFSQTEHVSLGDAVAESIASVLTTPYTVKPEEIPAKLSRLLSTAKEIAKTSPDMMVNDLYRANFVSSVLIEYSTAEVAEAYSLCRNGARLSDAEHFRSSGAFHDLVSILRLDPEHATELIRSFHAATSTGTEMADHRELYLTAAKAAGQAPYIDAAFFALGGIFRDLDRMTEYVDFEHTTSAGCPEDQLLKCIPGCGKFTGALIDVVGRNREIPKKVPSRELIISNLKAIIRCGEISDETKCKVFHALLSDELSQRELLRPIMGVKKFASWNAKITAKEDGIIRADFISKCNLEMEPGDYLKKLKKY